MTKLFTVVAVCSLWLVCLAAAPAQQPGGDPANKTLKNPVPATAASIAAGRQATPVTAVTAMDRTAPATAALPRRNPPPPDLSDAKWDRGSGEADIFLVIWNGPSEKAPMKPLKGTVSENVVWNIVNYVRSLSPKTGAP